MRIHKSNITAGVDHIIYIVSNIGALRLYVAYSLMG